EVALAVIMVIAIVVVFGIGFTIWYLLRGHNGMADLMFAIVETLERIKKSIPADMAAALPDTVDDLRDSLGSLLHEHSQRISAAGVAGVKTFVHILLGM